MTEPRAELNSRQDDLESQFARAQQQLATLSGTGGVLPVDLVASIGLFPLLLGLIVAALLLRGAQARRQAALAAEDLAAAGEPERAARDWLVRRALGGVSPAVAILASLGIAAAAAAWTALASLEVANSPMTPPLSPWRALAIGVAAILAAAAWDTVMVRRLAAGAGR